MWVSCAAEVTFGEREWTCRSTVPAGATSSLCQRAVEVGVAAVDDDALAGGVSALCR